MSDYSRSYVDYLYNAQGLCINPCISALMTHYTTAKRPVRPLSAASRRFPWTNRAACACWTIERLEHVELVAARYGIRRAAASLVL
jgi:hypothetical protein